MTTCVRRGRRHSGTNTVINHFGCAIILLLNAFLNSRDDKCQRNNRVPDFIDEA